MYPKINLLPILSSFLLFLSFPKGNQEYLAWGALVPLIWAVENKNAKQAFWMGWGAGTAAFCGILYWIVPTFRAAGVSLILGLSSTLLLSSVVGLFYGVFTVLSSLYLQSFAYPSALIFCGTAWVALEHLRSYLWTGFPWALLGYSQWKFTPMIQISEWTGVYGVSFLLVLFNLILYALIKKRKVVLLPTLILGALLIANLYLWVRTKKVSESYSKPLRISILQGNIDQYRKWDKTFVREIQNTYSELALESSSQSDLIVWPESALPGWFPNELELEIWARNLVRKTGKHHILGAVTQSENQNFNSAFLMDPDGKIVERYDKIHLVPFGEYVPWERYLTRWIRVLNMLGGFHKGEKSAPFAFGNTLLGVNICYEAIFPHLVRKQALAGAEVLVNLTNDGWYLDSAALEQHFSMNVFRAVENRRPVVRAANTGISGVIVPTGNPIQRTEMNQKMICSQEVSPRKERTIYTRYGDLFAWGCDLWSVWGLFLFFAKKCEG
ncbi:MAG: apolipoprotein N-acyltransferase [Elusimicrobia bacterium]|nr:apolipoprotein N-acyltransferase [Elusimicrobiota bacterium]